MGCLPSVQWDSNFAVVVDVECSRQNQKRQIRFVDRFLLHQLHRQLKMQRQEKPVVAEKVEVEVDVEKQAAWTASAKMKGVHVGVVVVGIVAVFQSVREYQVILSKDWSVHCE